MRTYIYDDPSMKENNSEDVKRRITNVLSDEQFLQELDRAEKNWLDMDTSEVVRGILAFFDHLN